MRFLEQQLPREATDYDPSMRGFRTEDGILQIIVTRALDGIVSMSIQAADQRFNVARASARAILLEFARKHTGRFDVVKAWSEDVDTWPGHERHILLVRPIQITVEYK